MSGNEDSTCTHYGGTNFDSECVRRDLNRYAIKKFSSPRKKTPIINEFRTIYV